MIFKKSSKRLPAVLLTICSGLTSIAQAKTETHSRNEITFRLPYEEAEVLSKLSRELRITVESRIRELKEQFVQVRNLHLAGPQGLRSMSMRSFEDYTSGVDAYLVVTAVRDFRDGLQNIKLKAAELSHLKGLPDPADELDILSEITGEVVAAYEEELKILENEVNGLQFLVKLTDGTLSVFAGFEIEGIKENFQPTPQQLKELRNKEKRLRSDQRHALEAAKRNFSAQIFRTSRNFIDAFGTSQRYRARENEAFQEEVRQDLREAFWARSYLRAVYGVQLGSYIVKHQKRWFNLDAYFTPNVVEVTGFTSDTNELLISQDNAYAAVSIISGRELKELKLGIPRLSTIAGVQEILAGRGAEVMASAEVTSLIAADIYEERTLAKAGGLKAMRAHYRSRYYKTAEDEAYFKFLEKKYVDGEPDADDIEADEDVVSSNNLVGVFRLLENELQSFEDRRHQADKIKRMIQKYTKGNKVTERRKKRTEI